MSAFASVTILIALIVASLIVREVEQRDRHIGAKAPAPELVKPVREFEIPVNFQLHSALRISSCSTLVISAYARTRPS